MKEYLAPVRTLAGIRSSSPAAAPPASLMADADGPCTSAHAGSSATSPSLEASKLAACGGISGAFAKTCTAPVARLTILYQVNGLMDTSGPGPPRPRPLLGALRHVVSQQGWRSLWRGNMATLLHRIPYSSTNFYVYEETSRSLRPHVGSDVGRRFAAGATSGLVACTVAYPLDLVRTRIAAQLCSSSSSSAGTAAAAAAAGTAAAAGGGGGGGYNGIIQSLARIAAEEGPLGLYKGLSATLVQVVPTLALSFCLYDTFRAATAGKDAPPTVVTSLGCATLSGFATASATYPLDVIRRRMQVHGAGSAGRGLRYWDAWRLAIARGGLRGLYTGIIPEYCKVVPGQAIAFVTYEALRQTSGMKGGLGHR